MNVCSGTFVPLFPLREMLLSSSNNLSEKQIGLNALVQLQDAACSSEALKNMLTFRLIVSPESQDDHTLSWTEIQI